jgi:hypothetical protein
MSVAPFVEPTEIYLTATDGPTGWWVDLTDDDSHYVLWSQASFPTPMDSSTQRALRHTQTMSASGPREIVLPLRITGPTPADMIDNKRAVERMLVQATNAYERDSGSRIRFGYRWAGAAEASLWDVYGAHLTNETVYPDWIQANLVLTVGLDSYGRRRTLARSATITAASMLYALPQTVLGDRPAPATITLRDLGSAPKAINRIRLAAYGSSELERSGAFVPVINAQPDGGIATTTTVASAYLTDVERMPTTSVFRRAAKFNRPSRANASEQDVALDMFLRVIDPSAPLSTPGTPTLSELRPVGVVSKSFVYDATSATTHTFDWGNATSGDSGSTVLPTDRKTLRLVVVTGNSSNIPTIPGYITRRSLGSFYLLENYDDTNEGTVTVTHPTAFSNFYAWAICFDGVAAGASEGANDQHARNNNTGQQITSGVTHDLSQPYELAYAWLKGGVAVGGVSYQTPIIDQQSVWSVELNKEGGVVEWYATETTDGVVATADIKANDGAPWWAFVETYKALAERPSTLTAGNYGVRVTALDLAGAESLVSASATLTLATRDALSVDWTNVTSADRYRVYLTFDGVTYLYETPDNTSALTILSLDDGLVASIPSVAQTTCAQYQVWVDNGSGVNPRSAGIVSGQRGNGVAELIYLGVISPGRRKRDGTLDDWRVYIDVAHPWATLNVDIDCLITMPHDCPQAIVEYAGGDLNTPRAFELDVTRDGHVSALLRDLSSDIVRSSALARTGLWLEPGTCLIFALVEVSDATTSLYHDLSASYTLDVEYEPAYRDFVGNP